MNNSIWVYSPKPATLKKADKEKLSNQLNEVIKSSERLLTKIHRIDIRAGRIYFYSLEEVTIPPGAIPIKPLIDGKYAEFTLARITLYDNEGNNCKLDWQRYNDQWITLFDGNLKDCITCMDKNEQWF